MHTLRAGDYELDLVPPLGGGIGRFTWRGVDVMRAGKGPSPLELACFPLVPFSNRIAAGRFTFRGHAVRLAPTHAPTDPDHPLHGYGWLAAWQTEHASANAAVLAHHYPGGDWPWPYSARQSFALTTEGLSIELDITNTGPADMPAGLGFHPYFPCPEDASYVGLHRREWLASADCLPARPLDSTTAIDWWHGAPLRSRSVDTVWEDRAGPLVLQWPSRGLGVRIEPSANLPCTVVYVPADAPFFCVEPVSHVSNAPNLGSARHGLATLAPGQTMRAGMTVSAYPV